jgi:hypothetical protein
MTRAEAAQIVLQGVKYVGCPACQKLGYVLTLDDEAYVPCTLCHARGGYIDIDCIRAFQLLDVALPFLTELPRPVKKPTVRSRILELQQAYLRQQPIRR